MSESGEGGDALEDTFHAAANHLGQLVSADPTGARLRLGLMFVLGIDAVTLSGRVSMSSDC